MGATYESIIQFALVVFFGYGFSALSRFRGEPGPLMWAFQGYLFLVIGLYFVWFWSNGRRTLPMRTVGLRLVDGHGRSLRPLRAALRYLICWLLLLGPLGAGLRIHPGFLVLLAAPFVWGLFDRQGQTLYDRLAGTRLVIDTRPIA